MADLSIRETVVAEHALPADTPGSVEVDVSSLTPGASLVVNWNGRPVVVRNRTERERKDSEAVNLADLKDPIARNANLPADAPATDANRTTPGKEAWIVMVQVCTHLGCIPFEQDADVGVPRVAIRHRGTHPQRPGTREHGGASVPIHFRHRDPYRLRQRTCR
jgi:ubiquinol-cytochrome c reductase iron-sulfur subunit